MLLRRLVAFGQAHDGEPPRVPRDSTSSHPKHELEDPEQRPRRKHGPVVTLALSLLLERVAEGAVAATPRVPHHREDAKVVARGLPRRR
eukprot:9399637-Pyramimonas_sp.AAC.1